MDTRKAGAMGGNKTKQLYGVDHFKRIQMKGVLARKRNQRKAEKELKQAISAVDKI